MNKFNKIKNIIFDLGNVVLDIDLNITVQRFIEMGWNGDENFLDKYHQKTFFGDYEHGLINTDAFISEIKALTKYGNSEAEIKEAWNALLLDYKEERIQCILELKKHYKVFLLSNTNALHIDHCSERVPFVGSLDNLFDKTYYSYEMGVRKPDAIIYQSLLEDADIIAEETLFLDDSLRNVQEAQKMGIESWVVEDADAWVGRITSYLL